MNMYHAGKERRSGVFDPNDAEKVRHIRLGTWDLYEERPLNCIFLVGRGLW